jgi:hypothetical protein
MKRAASLLAVTLFLIELLLAAPTSASNPHSLLQNPGPLELDESYCEGFKVLITWTPYNQYVIRATTSSDGTQTLKVTGDTRKLP